MKKTDEITPYLLRLREEMQTLNRLKIKVGIQGDAEGDILTIARIHEYGATITAKSTKNLCIPIHPDSYDKSPRDFPDLVFVRSQSGYLFGAVEKKGGSKEDRLKFLFLLLPSVNIPERSFIRAGFDHNKDKLAEIVQKEVTDIYQGKQTARQAAEWIGGKAADLIMEYIKDASNFKPKGRIQRERYPSWADNPLIVTGRLRNSITYKVEET